MPLSPRWTLGLQGKKPPSSLSAIGTQGLSVDPIPAAGVGRSADASSLPSREYTSTTSVQFIPDISRGSYVSSFDGIEQGAVDSLPALGTSYVGYNLPGWTEHSHYNQFSNGGQGQAVWSNPMDGSLPMNSNLSNTVSFSTASINYGPALFQDPYPTLFGGGQPLPLALGGLSQQAFGIGRGSDSTPDQSTALRAVTLVGFDAPARATVIHDMPKSWVYREALAAILKDHPWQSWVRPYPPGHNAVTGAGYNPKEDHFISLDLRDRETPDQIVQLSLTVLDRDLTSERYPREVDMVLCRDYVDKLGIGFSSLRYQNELVIAQYPSDAASLAGVAPSLAGGSLADPSLLGWSFPSNCMQNPDIQFEHQHSSLSNVLSTRSGSGGVVSSATSSGGIYPVEGQTNSRV